jgi:hypothetical protein
MTKEVYISIEGGKIVNKTTFQKALWECKDGRYLVKIEPKKKRTKVRADFLKAHPTCEVGTCTKKATDIHHKCGRRKKYLSNPKYFLAVCRGHHLFVESHPIWARENGYSLSRLSTENKTI